MRILSGPLGVGLSIWLAAAAALHIYYAGFGFPEPLKLATLHLFLFVPPVFLLYPAGSRSSRTSPTLVDWLFAVLAMVPSAYVYFNTGRVYDRSAFIEPLTMLEVALGTILVILVIEAVRRALSVALSLLVGIVLVYMFICHLLPGVWYYRDLPYNQIVEIMYLADGSGLYGQLTGISATIVAAFLVFGAFLQASGMGRLFMNLGSFMAGRFVGGPAKIAVVTSAMFGMTSGSSVANVVVTGSVTIPMMKRIGFRPSFASGVEAASSVGGLIMPPVMGAAAFIMAEMISVPYIEIAIAASLGAVLYYFGILVTVHLEAKRLGIAPMAREELPRARDLLADVHLVLPLGVLIGLMMMRYSAYYAAFWSTVAMVVVSWLRRHTRMGPRDVFAALVDAGRTICIIAVAVTAAGLIMAGLTSTGLLLAFSGIIKSVAGDSLLLLVLLVAATCLFLGMGVPTAPAYIITAAIGAPLIAEHGMAPLLSIHMFVLYFAVLADATPPVAAASYAAAAIGQANPITTGFQAFRLAAGGFVAGIAFIYEPALTLHGTVAEIAGIALALAAGLVLIAAGLVGHIDGRLPLWLRPVLLAAGALCALGHTVPDWYRAIGGFILIGVVFSWSRWRFGAGQPQPHGTVNSPV